MHASTFWFKTPKIFQYRVHLTILSLNMTNNAQHSHNISSQFRPHCVVVTAEGGRCGGAEEVQDLWGSREDVTEVMVAAEIDVDLSWRPLALCAFIRPYYQAAFAKFGLNMKGQAPIPSFFERSVQRVWLQWHEEDTRKISLLPFAYQFLTNTGVTFIDLKWFI